MPDFETLQRAGLMLGILPVGYLGVGAVFALVYGLFLPGRLEPAARGAPLGFRLIILPATMLMWPMLLRRLLTPSGRRR